jgi:hypothetical protein
MPRNAVVSSNRIVLRTRTVTTFRARVGVGRPVSVSRNATAALEVGWAC